MTPGGPVGLRRVEAAKVVEHRDATLVLGGDGRVHRFPADSGALVAEVMRLLARPRSRDELHAALTERFEDVGTNTGTIDQAIEHLKGVGAIAAPGPSASPHSHAHARGSGRKVVLGLTGAVATAMSPHLAATLVGAGHTVRVAMTKAARRFVTPTALEVITHQPVVRGLWHRTPELPTPHINLAEWAEAVVVCPASATTLSRLARGDCSDLVSALAVATSAPVVLMPSMNAAMYEAPAVQRNLELLRDDGFHVVLPGFGHEVAHAPSQRAPAMGPAPGPREVLAVLEAVLQTASVPRSPQMAEWDARYRELEPEQMPWHTDVLDGDLVDVLSVLPRPQNVLDLGTGLGTVARELARRGLTVTASDLSAVALSRAQTTVAGLPVKLVHDDITRTRLVGPFELVLDRAVLHLLPEAQQADYLRCLSRLVPRGSHLVVKVHAADEQRFDTRKFTAEALEQLLAPAFEPVRITDSSLPGPVTPPAKALLGVFRRAG
ncbi:MAG: methyltransferase domain-containing protein [Archangiaceae bacterium]|nr:methyltransferase domain-containing protein [Archangiaceae bacterium]